MQKSQEDVGLYSRYVTPVPMQLGCSLSIKTKTMTDFVALSYARES